MQIVNELSGVAPTSRLRSAEQAEVEAEKFSAALKRAAAAAGQGEESKAEKAASQKQQEKSEKIEAARQAMLTELHDYLKKSPAEHIRDAVLKELGLSEESLAAMPPEQRMALEAEINERIREKLLGRKPEPGQEAAAKQTVEAAAEEKGGAVADALRMALAGTRQEMIKAT